MTAAERVVGRPTRVFISYAHESAEHVEAVRDLWVVLRSQGVDAKLDLPAAERRQDWALWMVAEIREADFVLVVASPEYRRRSEGEAEPTEGRGVQFEAALIREELYRDRNRGFARILPVVLPGGSRDDIPSFLGPTTGTSYDVSEVTPAGVESLVRVLTEQPFEVEAPLGPVPNLVSRVQTAVNEKTREGIEHEIVFDVSCEGERVRTRILLAGTLLAEHMGALPAGIEDVWNALSQSSGTAEARLVDAGERFRRALMDEIALGHITELLDNSPLGSVFTIVIRADGSALGLPYELLPLRDGRLLATVPGVRFRRVVRGLERQTTAPLPGPLKILVAVGAPDETRTASAPLDVEGEMQAILDAVGGVSAGSASVTILEVAGPRQIAEALRRDQYHVLHLSAHGSQSGVELEDEDGNPVPVDAADLVRQMRSAGRALPLIMLSSCAGGAGGSHGLAVTLVRHGADRVVAMQTGVTDTYATQLARAFYDGLTGARGVSVSAALADARRQLEEQAQAAKQTGARRTFEHSVVTMITAGEDPPLVDIASPEDPLAHPTAVPAGGGVRQLPIGYLIGRRRELRTAVAAMRGGPEAVDRWGAVSGVLLTGVGGIEKTALAGRIEARLTSEGWLSAVHVGRWNPAALTDAVADAVAGIPALSMPMRS